MEHLVSLLVSYLAKFYFYKTRRAGTRRIGHDSYLTPPVGFGYFVPVSRLRQQTEGLYYTAKYVVYSLDYL